MVKNYYSLLVGSNDFFPPWKSFWKQKIPSRVAFFVWTAALGKCLTIDYFRKRNVWILDWCYMCQCNGELVDHLFLHFPVAMDLWSMVLCLFGVSWVMPQSVVGLLACWQGWFGHYRNEHIWIIVPHYLMWWFWEERNVGVLKITRAPYQTSSYFSLELYWIGCLVCETNHSLDFLDSCNFCT